MCIPAIKNPAATGSLIPPGKFLLARPNRLKAMSSSTNPIFDIYRIYAALSATLPPPFQFDPHVGLGGKLLYAGEIDESGRALLFAGNIAGAASLAASADPLAQRSAIRDGVVDFAVTSLEEALRILKNEIRKRQAVSVGVGLSADALTRAMLDRGVLPDLLGPAVAGLGFEPDGAQSVLSLELDATEFISWSVDGPFARWMPRLDACVQAVVPADDLVRQRWLRLAPRYLGRMAQREHGVVLSAAELAALREQVRAMRSEFADGAMVEIRLSGEPI